MFRKHAGAAAKSGFCDIFRALAKLCFAAVVIATILPAAQTYAQETFAFVAANGGGTACTATAPCATVGGALFEISPPVRVLCVSGSAEGGSGILYTTATPILVDIDCPLGSMAQLQFGSPVPSATVRVRHLGFFKTTGFTSQLIFQSSGTLVLEDCVFTDAPGAALDIEPNGPLKLVIRNSRISNAGSGILLKPAAGGSITATLDRVTIADSNGGGLKIDTTNGPVTLDITDSDISGNSGNGVNAVASGANQVIVSIKNSVIAKNAVAGVQANGANAGVLVQTTLFDQNATGATSVVGGGHISTYGNNSIVGSAGSGFTGTAGLQ